MSHSPPTLPDASTAPPAKATRREWFGLAVIALPCLVYAMDLTVLNLALPAISADLRPTGAQLLWIIDIYGFMVAGFLITMGTLGDRIGRRRLLMIGAAAFAAPADLTPKLAQLEKLEIFPPAVSLESKRDFRRETEPHLAPVALQGCGKKGIELRVVSIGMRPVKNDLGDT